MALKSFSALKRRVKDRDTYWVESAKNEFARKIAAFAESKGMTHSQIAQKAGCSPATVSKIMRADENVSIEMMVRLCRSVGCELHLQILAAQTLDDEGEKTKGV